MRLFLTPSRACRPHATRGEVSSPFFLHGLKIIRSNCMVNRLVDAARSLYLYFIYCKLALHIFYALHANCCSPDCRKRKTLLKSERALCLFLCAENRNRSEFIIIESSFSDLVCTKLLAVFHQMELHHYSFCWAHNFTAQPFSIFLFIGTQQQFHYPSAAPTL